MGLWVKEFLTIFILIFILGLSMMRRLWMSEISLCPWVILRIESGQIIGSTYLYSTIIDRYRLSME
jgi:hypothetical protein